MHTDVLDKLLYADDLAENARIRDKNARGHKHVATMTLQSAPKMTEVVYQPAPRKQYSEPTISVNRQNCKLLINSPIGVALSPEPCTLIMRLLSEIRRPLWHFVDFPKCLGADWNQT